MKDYNRKDSRKKKWAGVLIVVLILLSLGASIWIEVLSDRDLKNKENELNKYVLGEGYAIFYVFGRNTAGEYFGGIKSQSKYPLYDISLLVTDFDEAIKCKTSSDGNNFFFDQDCYFESSTNVKTNTLPLGLLSYVEYYFKSTSEFKNLEIIFTSRNNRILQQAVYKLQKGSCPVSFRIYKFEEGGLKLIKTNNDLGLVNSYWDKNFYPVQNRHWYE